jgi:transcriptional regulator GlxA family with amidase domain
MQKQSHRVVVLVLDGVLPMDVGIPLQVFAVRPGFPYRLHVCAEVPGLVATGAGIDIAVRDGLELVDSADTVIVPGYAPHSRPVSSDVTAALVRAHDRGARVVSICYGAFALAQAGLLDGLRATTHWDAAADLARRYPGVRVDPNVLYVDEDPVLTSAGVAAGMDLCLYMVRKDLGAKAANEIARRLVTAPRRAGGQAQYASPVAHTPAAGETLDSVRAWMLEHLAEPVTVAELATRANLSRRTFERRFTAETSAPPHRWILQARLDAARVLLEDTGLPVERIAANVGLGTGSNLRLHFGRRFGTTPHRYRTTFATTGTSRHDSLADADR